ncbi:MAG TPA: uracil-DNA glycosylase [Rubrivivax sp.]|nr:uracil-DNA glycosylase [Rubrivivax sp.]
MSWTAQQRNMLAAMGLRVWAPPAPAAAAAEPQAAAAASAQQRAPAFPQPREAPPVPVPAPRAMAAPASPVAELDWSALREAVAGCRACGLCTTRTQTVFGVGHPQAQWMVIGEAPGEQEDLQGEPFVGASGQLLDRMLAALQLSRVDDDLAPTTQRVFIANTLKCRPPRNRNPTPEELQRCEPFLMRQIELVRPRIILAMGAFAVKALLRTDQPVGRLRGQVHRYHGVPLVVTYHPAYLLRSLTDKARAWEDLCLAAQVADEQAGDQPQATAAQP